MSTTADFMGLGMPPTLAARLGNNPVTIAGVGTVQTGAGTISSGTVALLSPTASNTAFVLSAAFSTGRAVYVWNTSSTLSATVFPPSGGTLNGGATNAGLTLGPLSGGLFQLTNGSGVAAETWYANLSGTSGVGSAAPQIVYNAVSTAPTANNLNLTGANITGASGRVVLNLTATLGAGATATLPTVAALVTAMQAANLNPVAGASYELDILNTSSGNFAWTTTTNTGWTLTGTQTVAQNTRREYSLTFTSLTAVALQSLGQVIVASV